jgi:hypothetical protein
MSYWKRKREKISEKIRKEGWSMVWLVAESLRLRVYNQVELVSVT